MNHSASCHCGQLSISFESTIDHVVDCNCSHCRKKGFLLTFMPKEQTHITLPTDGYSTYTFNKHVIAHHFCKVCGCAPFGIGTRPDGTQSVAINVRCLDVPLDLTSVKVVAYDGAAL